MNYEEFKAEYIATFKRMVSYKPSECGSTLYAENLADLADAYPEFADRAENEVA